ncbi:MAG: mechanosensitive ion channel family protein [Bacteroidota bacterium]
MLPELELLIPYARYAVIIISVLVVAYASSRLFRMVFRKVADKTAGKNEEDTTNYRFLQNAVTAFIYTIALIVILYSIPQLRAYGVTLFAGAGVVTIVLGFASQEALSNIVGGIFIVIFKPFRIKDIVQIGTNTGVIEDITLRHTVIKDWDNKRIIIPNSTISRETIINWNVADPRICNRIEVGISYDSDLDLAKTILAEEAIKHPLHIDVRTPQDIADGKPQILIRLVNFAESSIMLRVFIWTKDPVSGFELKSDYLSAVKKRFDAEGIEIPFPYRTLVFKNQPPADGSDHSTNPG